MNTAARDSVLRVLATAVHESGRAQVVAPSAHVAHRVARLFEEKGCAATPIHTSSEGESRIRRGGKDDEHDVWQLITPAVGPQPGAPTEADLGIVLSPARNRRQLVERMQRNLGGRRDRHVRLVVLYIEGSVEDDAVGEETALGGVMTHARRLQRFTSRDTDALLDFLSSGRRVVTLPADTEVSQQIPTNR
jgi:hypothetical protein